MTTTTPTAGAQLRPPQAPAQVTRGRTASMSMAAKRPPKMRPRPPVPRTLADLTPAELREAELSFHESGHSVAAVVLGGRIHSAVVNRGGRVADTSGLTTMHTMPAAGREAEIAYAGPWSEARWKAGKRPTTAQLRAVLDSTGCRDAAQMQMSGGAHHTGPTVAALLERCWPSIVTLAQRLYLKGEARHEDVLAALHLTEQTAAMGLALIRSGSTPGTFTVSLPG